VGGQSACGEWFGLPADRRVTAHHNCCFATRDDTPQQLMPSFNNVQKSWFIFRFTKCGGHEWPQTFPVTQMTRKLMFVCSTIIPMEHQAVAWQHTSTNVTLHGWYRNFNLIRTVTENAASASSLRSIWINPYIRTPSPYSNLTNRECWNQQHG